ncbi:hypothetical protein BBF96_12680 [Anoxybacter fermentans]|uniref:HTH cro/C1-type domain-containing protein n=1 Tax=Anoxybacter fermentans TaxID=1323375 RepID=A0A3Q9HSD8_9FIRM|nr:helix-turn-helix transcriptional regulator [Anoxybacter fermentans]AZR74175.1 hypothetical protein BBF96_12680 [Anoxybacter fermentans]
MEELTKLVFEKIEILKNKFGISDQDIARGIGVSKSSYSRIRNGKTKLTLDVLLDIARYFNLPAYYFILASDRLDQYSFSTLLKDYLDKLNWTYEKLAQETGILIFRFMEFDQGSNPTKEELKKIESVLTVHFPQMSLDPREHAIKLLLEELGLEERKIENILQYIGQNKSYKT